jgi:hypothetical protein
MLVVIQTVVQEDQCAAGTGEAVKVPTEELQR